MSDLDDQLRAQGGACEHLARLFAYKRGMSESGFPCPSLSTTPWTDAVKQLLARIAELEAENERLETDRILDMDFGYYRKLEATIERQREDLATVDVQLGDERLKNRRLEAERDRMLDITPEELAEKFHAIYEGAAESMNYQTKPESAVSWDDVPAQNKALMIATCAEVLADLRARAEEGVE